ncbi:hypothetical protein K0504_12925 [Neiella marina]|uniref:Uncharacterized protein n=1 Tax=Neiella holothuriorum TaxID=2870530 RepID=A0ABS7EHW6_9GAMM|nr:hypothetical protein [Neiella holothuriorum]MBW8191942.1 hypothetical protein [Neiella holothuriorum]
MNKSHNQISAEFYLKQGLDRLPAEVAATTAMLIMQFGPLMCSEQYAELFDIKHGTVERQISDETIAVKPKKVGRKNFFPTVSVALLVHAKEAA